MGQEKPKQILKNALQNSSVAHAYLFYGQESIGKKQIAIELAKSLKQSDSIVSPICFVGSHTSALPLEVLSEDCVDLVLLNEGYFFTEVGYSQIVIPTLSSKMLISGINQYDHDYGNPPDSLNDLS